MADAEATLRVNVEGEEQIQSLNEAIAGLAAQSGRTTEQMTADLQSAADFTGRSLEDIVQNQTRAYAEGARLREEALAEGQAHQDRALADADSFLSRLKAKGEQGAAGQAQEGQAQQSGAMGTINAAVAGFVGGISAAIGEKLLTAAGDFARSIDLIGTSLAAANTAAERNVELYREAVRTGETLAQTQTNQMAGSAIGIEDMGRATEMLNKQLSDARATGKMEDVFRQAGLSPENLRAMREMGGGRLEVLDVVSALGGRIANLRQQMEAAGTEVERARFGEQLGQTISAAFQTLGPRLRPILDAALAFTPEDLGRIKQSRAEITQAYGAPTQADVDLSKRYQDQRAQIDDQMAEYTNAVGRITMEPINRFTESLNSKMLQLGPAMARLQAGLGATVWDGLAAGIEGISSDQTVGAINRINAAVDRLRGSGAAGGVGAFAGAAITGVLDGIATSIEDVEKIIDTINKVQEGYQRFVDKARATVGLKTAAQLAAEAPPEAPPEGVQQPSQTGWMTDLANWTRKQVGARPLEEVWADADAKAKSSPQPVTIQDARAVPGAPAGAAGPTITGQPLGAPGAPVPVQIVGERMGGRPAEAPAAPIAAPPAPTARPEAAPQKIEVDSRGVEQAANTLKSAGDTLRGAGAPLQSAGQALQSAAGPIQSAGGPLSSAASALQSGASTAASAGSSIQAGGSALQAAAGSLQGAGGPLQAAAGAISAAAGSLAAAAASIPRSISVNVGAIPGGGGGASTGASAPSS